MKFRRSIIAVLFMALFLMLENTKALATFVVTPMEFHLNVAGGESATGSFWVRNRGSETIALKIYMGDFWIDLDGKESFLEPGAVERSCSKWLEIAPEELELNPGESKSVRFNLTMPPEKTGTYWAMIFIEQTNKPTIKTEQKGQQQFNILSFQRVGVRVYQETPDSVKGEGRITQVTVERDKKDNAVKVNLKIENNGDALLRCKGSVEIKDDRGETVETISMEEFNCYPRASRVAPAFSKINLKPGQYTALAVIDYGAEYLVAGEALFKVNAITGSIDMTSQGQQAVERKPQASVSVKVAPPVKKDISKPAENKNNFMESVKSAWTKITRAFSGLFRR